MSLTRFRPLTALLLLTLCLVSCSKGRLYYIFNNVGTTLDIEMGSFKTTIAVRESAKIAQWSPEYPSALVIYTHDRHWRYPLQFGVAALPSVNGRTIDFPPAYAHPAGFTIDYWLQVEPDGTLCPIPANNKPGDAGISGGPFCIEGQLE
jgi:hypothetical protein